MTEDAAHTAHTHVCPRQHQFQQVHLAHTSSSLYRRGKSTNAICSIITLVEYKKDAKAEVCMVDFLVKMTIQANSSTNLK
jgi:hypothetical protein